MTSALRAKMQHRRRGAVQAVKIPLRAGSSPVWSLLYMPPGAGIGLGDYPCAREHRGLLENYRHGTRWGRRAGARDRWLKRVPVAVSVQAYTRWMGQRCHGLAPEGSADPLEAFRRNP